MKKNSMRIYWTMVSTVTVITIWLGSFSSWAAGQKIKIVTTVAPITNIVYNIGGDQVDLHGIVPEGVNSHTFEPAPSDAKVLAEADLIIINGLHLELPTQSLATKVKKKETKVLSLGDNTISKKEWRFDFSFPEAEGNPNPHLWPNIPHTMKYAELVRNALVSLDPKNKDYYVENTGKYLKQLDLLDKAIFECVKSIPEKNRKLVTYHDSFAYFAPRYGMTVIGAIQPSDFSDPTPREVARIIDQLKKEKVPAIFGSEVFPSKIVSQIAREAGAKVVDTLRDDDLPGEQDDPEHTFVGMMKQNMIHMAGALGGNPACIQGLDARNVIGK
ncbi:MAG: metal ABC transporter substrate-binding protein [Nitrospira sp.]|nr:metal ABC transporter substrate-binding protein [Nitrospira sp.]